MMKHSKLWISSITVLVAGLIFAGTALAGGPAIVSHSIDTLSYDCSTNSISLSVTMQIASKLGPTHTVSVSNTTTGQSSTLHNNFDHNTNSPVTDTFSVSLTVQPGNSIQAQSSIAGASSGNPIVTRTLTIPSCPSGFSDGRLNPYPASNAVIYCSDTVGIHVYGYSKTTKVWSLAFFVSAADLAKLPAKPATNTLIKQVTGIALYKLTTGEYQLNVGPDSEGKTVVFIWRGCRPDTLYSQELHASLPTSGLFAMSPAFIQ